MASTSNTQSDKMVTRLRKQKNLETAMDTIKKLLKPDKKGSRKKNKPRIIVKKIIPKKIQRPSQDIIQDVEFFPNKLKRTVESKKIVLKPKTRLKIIVAVNKRKRGTPHKGIEWDNFFSTDTQTDSNIKKQTVNHKTMVINPKMMTVDHKPQNPFQIKNEGCDNPHLTIEDQLRLNKVKNEDFKSQNLTMEDALRVNKIKEEVTSQYLTMEEVMRMDEEVLTDEDFLEILTCPSPVWWEDPPDIDRNAFLPLKITKNMDITSKVGINKDMKRKNTINDNKKAKKKAKLENILDSIRNRVASDNNNGVDKIHNEKEDDLMMTATGNNDVNNDVNNDNSNSEESNSDEYTKQRKISTSGSEVSLNEEDLVRNLQSIDIPIQHFGFNSDAPKTDEKKTIDDTIDVIVQSPKRDIEHITEKTEENEQNLTSDSKICIELRNKELLKRLHKENNDILDVRILKKPCHTTNEVTVWSAVGDFKPLDSKNKKTNEVIDVEDEIQFSIIESGNKDVNNDKFGTKIDHICINDDSNEGNNDDVIYLEDSLSDIETEECTEKVNDEKITDGKIADEKITHGEDLRRKSDSYNQKDTDTLNEKDIIKEDTIKMCNLDVRLIETSNSENSNEKSVEIPGMSQIKTQNIDVIPTQFDATVLESSEINEEPVKIINTNRNMNEINTNNNECVQYNETNSYDLQIKKNEITDKENVDNETVSENNSEIDTSKSENTHIENKNEKYRIGVTSVPQFLTTISKYSIQNALDSPRSVKSMTESLDGTISDTNVQFIDEYIKSGDEDNISMEEEYLDDDYGEQNVNEDKKTADLNEVSNESESVNELGENKKEKNAIDELVTVYRIVDKNSHMNNDKNDVNTATADYESDLTDTDNDDINDEINRDKDSIIKITTKV